MVSVAVALVIVVSEDSAAGLAIEDSVIVALVTTVLVEASGLGLEAPITTDTTPGIAITTVITMAIIRAIAGLTAFMAIIMASDQVLSGRTT